MQVNRIESLTFLRFVAALIVVIYHYGSKTTLAQIAQPAITSGPQMVTFFFALSGFVLMLAYYHKIVSFKDFYLARLARIAPAYFVALGISYYLSSQRVQHGIAPVLHLTFLQSWFPDYPMMLNSPAWSLSVEIFFYLTFPILLLAIKTTKVQFKTFLLLSMLVWLFTQFLLVGLFNAEFYTGPRTASHNFIMYFPLFHYCSFLLGVAGGYAFVKTQSLHRDWGMKGIILLILLFAIVYCVLQYPHVYLGLFPFSVPVSVGFYAPLFLVLILCISYSQNVIIKFLSLPVLVMLGEISYAVYIFQAPIHLIYLKYIGKYLQWDVDQNFYAYLLILIGWSIFAYYLIEKPGRKLVLQCALWIKNFSVKSNSQPSQR